MSKETFFNCYTALNITFDASEQEIKKSYRSLALKFHPDKYKGEKPEEAAKQFDIIAKANEILSDAVKRKEHDKVLEKHRFVEMHHAKMNAKKKRAMDNLSQREEAAKKRKFDTRSSEEARSFEISRLSDEMNELKMQYEKELEFNSRVMSTASKAFANSISASPPPENHLDFSIKVKWTRRKGDAHDENSLKTAFKEFGNIKDVFIGSKGNTAIIEFSEVNSVREALKHSAHLETTFGVKVSSVGGEEEKEKEKFEPPTQPLFPAYALDHFPFLVKSVDAIHTAQFNGILMFDLSFCNLLDLEEGDKQMVDYNSSTKKDYEAATFASL